MGFALTASAAEIPKGSHVLLRLVNTSTTRSAREGDYIYFRTASPIVAGGTILVPAGSYAQAVVTRSVRSDRYKGQSRRAGISTRQALLERHEQKRKDNRWKIAQSAYERGELLVARGGFGEPKHPSIRQTSFKGATIISWVAAGQTYAMATHMEVQHANCILCHVDRKGSRAADGTS